MFQVEKENEVDSFTTEGDTRRLDLLPNELICKMLDLQPTVLHLRLVCRRWKHIIDHLVFWKGSQRVVRMKTIENTALLLNSIPSIKLHVRIPCPVRYLNHRNEPFRRSWPGSFIEVAHRVWKVDVDVNSTILEDVSGLNGVHTLNLHSTKVSDVSALTNVHTLNLSRTKVTDVSALTNVHTLHLDVDGSHRCVSIDKRTHPQPHRNQSHRCVSIDKRSHPQPHSYRSHRCVSVDKCTHPQPLEHRRGHRCVSVDKRTHPQPQGNRSDRCVNIDKRTHPRP